MLINGSGTSLGAPRTTKDSPIVERLTHSAIRRKILPSKLRNYFYRKNRIKFLSEKPRNVILSHPKCGRTWHRVLIGSYLCQKYDIDQKKALHIDSVIPPSKIKQLLYSHDGSGNALLNMKREDTAVFEKNLDGHNVIILTRNVKDILVSGFYEAKYRWAWYDGDIHSFIRRKDTGIYNVLKVYNDWYNWSKMSNRFMHFTYEEMHTQAESVLKNTLEFLGETEIDENMVKNSVETAKFKNMKKQEKNDFFKNDAMQPTDKSEERSRKVRSGIIGSHKTELSEEDIEFVNKVETEIGNPFKPVL